MLLLVLLVMVMMMMMMSMMTMHRVAFIIHCCYCWPYSAGCRH